MGDKYILELEDKPLCVFDKDTQTYFPRLHRVKGFNSLIFDQNGLDKLTLYTEPDTEKVREEAFKNGYDAACKDIDIKSKINAAYRKGLEDAWEAVRKIGCYEIDGGYSVTQMLDLFDRDDLPKILSDYTASEAIEKIRTYEQEKQFCVGDEFEIESGKRFVIVKMDGVEIDRYIDQEGKTYCMFQKYKVMRKTGRHFPEIAEVLRKMREDTDG